MIDKDDDERAALHEAGQEGGAFVESLGRTDLATWSPNEWTTLVEVIVTAYQDALGRLRDGIPF
jgi:hypothetical protein